MEAHRFPLLLQRETHTSLLVRACQNQGQLQQKTSHIVRAHDRRPTSGKPAAISAEPAMILRDYDLIAELLRNALAPLP